MPAIKVICYLNLEGVWRIEIAPSPRFEVIFEGMGPQKAVLAWLEAFRVGQTVPLPPICPPSLPHFTKAVLDYLLTIPRGKVQTYAQVAAAIGSPKAARAVGGACGRNPLPLLFPCHRVVGSGGGFGGFSSGLLVKEELLKHEGFVF